MKPSLMRAAAAAAAAGVGAAAAAAAGPPSRRHLPSSFVWSLQQALLLMGSLFFIVLFSLQLLDSSCLLHQPSSSSAATASLSSPLFLTRHRNPIASTPPPPVDVAPIIPGTIPTPPRNLLLLQTPWNYLSFHSGEADVAAGVSASAAATRASLRYSESQPLPPPPVKLRIAVFVRKWPSGSTPGGLERHAFTLHYFLAKRGHEVHVFTAPGNFTRTTTHCSLFIHSPPLTAAATSYNPSTAWSAFIAANASSPFDIIHTESVAVHHTHAAELPNMVASWHGIAFEVVHSNIVSELLRPANESRRPDLQRTLSERLFKVSDEIRFFSSYRHHVAISDYMGEVLRTIYEIPSENVHVILSGVDSTIYRPSAKRGEAFRRAVGMAEEKYEEDDSAVVLGVAGRLVNDKGHPLLVEVLEKMMVGGIKEGEEGRKCKVRVVVAGDGPWAERYRKLEPCVKVLGSMLPEEMAGFYNGIDIFVNPTLRAQGLDLTLLEAMMSGKPVLATRFASITRSVVHEGSGVGYTFSPNAGSLRAALERVVAEGRRSLALKGEAAFRQASGTFTSTKMGLSYERLFMCITHARFCVYPPLFNSISPDPPPR